MLILYNILLHSAITTHVSFIYKTVWNVGKSEHPGSGEVKWLHAKARVIKCYPVVWFQTFNMYEMCIISVFSVIYVNECLFVLFSIVFF